MKTSMTAEIQSIIIAVQMYKQYVIADSIARKTFEKTDWYGKTFVYYKSLEIPDCLDWSVRCFEAILDYPIEKTLETQMENLPKQFEFGF